MLSNNEQYAAVFQVSEAFNITGKGCAIAGNIIQGTFKIGDKVEILRNDTVITHTYIIAIEMMNWGSDQTPRTDIVAFFLHGISKDDVIKDDYIAQGRR